ncbi:hypothetical protein ACYOEI_00335 [Singulisphaera rosea]
MKPYTYYRNSDGCDDTFDIIDADGKNLTSVHFWDEPTGLAARKAMADATLIVNALNAYQPKE